jgi:phage terminase small subunit
MTQKQKVAPPPDDLSPAAAELWRDAIAHYDSAAQQSLLAECLRALDTATAVRQAVEREGMFQVSERGKMAHAHPGVAIERAARSQFAKIAAMLGLEWR